MTPPRPPPSVASGSVKEDSVTIAGLRAALKENERLRAQLASSRASVKHLKGICEAANEIISLIADDDIDASHRPAVETKSESPASAKEATQAMPCEEDSVLRRAIKARIEKELPDKLLDVRIDKKSSFFADGEIDKLIAAHVATRTNALREELATATYEAAKTMRELNAELIQAQADLATLRKERDELRKALEAGHTNAYMALTCLEGLEIEAISRKRKAVPNFNEDSEWRNQVSAARLALDVAISALTRHEGREGQQKSDPVGTQDGIKGEGK